MDILRSTCPNFKVCVLCDQEKPLSEFRGAINAKARACLDCEDLIPPML